MQKVINVRASQRGLEDELAPYIRQGWRIVSTTKGSEWTRMFNTYRWTVVLEKTVSTNKASTKTMTKASTKTITSELQHAYELYKSGAISLDEYNKLKGKILNK